MTFNTLPILPDGHSTAATNVGSITTTVNGTIDAGGASTAVTFEYGLTAAYGTTVPGVPANVTGNTVTPVLANLTGLTIGTTYHYRVNGVNSVGTVNGGDMTFTTLTCPTPFDPGIITGPPTACSNTPGNIFSIVPISNATGYNWTLPAGAVITAGANTNSITVTLGSASGTVSVCGVNTCGNGPVSNLAVTVNASAQPTVTGPASLCVNSGYFNYTTQPGMTNYTWTISAGGTITWGQGTNQVQVQWPGAGAQSVSVNYMVANGCYAVTPTVFPVAVDPVPGAAGAITGSPSACGGAAGIAYSVAPVAGASAYVWALPAGATIVSGEGTNAITVDFAPDASSGDITVYGNNLCGNGAVSPPYAIAVTPLPEDAGTITGKPEVCKGDLGIIYSVPVIANATEYTWILPAGATVASGSGTNSITVDFSNAAVSGDITVTGTNSCGNGVASPAFPVTVNEVPPAPVIEASGEILTSSAPEGNQWYSKRRPYRERPDKPTQPPRAASTAAS